jgi:betaine-aldehyde dehydrogenase
MTVRTETARTLPKRACCRNSGAFTTTGWQEPAADISTPEPNRRSLGRSAQANAQDVETRRAAHRAFEAWIASPLERGALLKIAAAARRRGVQLLDAANCGNPVSDGARCNDGAAYIDFFAGLVTELKGDITPMGEEIETTVREPWACVHIVAYNHPLMFAAMKIARPATPSSSAPRRRSAYRMMELVDGMCRPASSTC